MKFTTGVTAVDRYNPGIIAQAFASLNVLYPGRIGLGIGTGEAMNEVPLGFDWPDAGVRLERTKETIQIINKLWKKKYQNQTSVTTYTEPENENGSKRPDMASVNFEGKHFRLKNARLYTPPSTDIYCYN
jgi:coenzyme F420-dependent glucose-6-phosphate dehydrogenase